MKNRKYVLHLFLCLLVVSQVSCRSICSQKPMVIAPIASVDSLNDIWIAQKYAPLMGIEADSIQKSIRIYQFINRWFESPYHIETKFGINDQTFAKKFYEDVYVEAIPNTFSTIRASKKFVFFQKYMCIQQGDILLFQELSPEKKVILRAVGIYLTNGKFILCSPRTGKVTIEQFYESYWFKRFLKAGRLKKQGYA